MFHIYLSYNPMIFYDILMITLINVQVLVKHLIAILRG